MQRSSNAHSAAVGRARLAVVSLLLALPPGSAHAFGGFWSSQGTPLEQSAVQVLLVDNPDSTITAVVRVEHTGPPQRFAWVIPVSGTPTVELSSATVFQRLEEATAPQHWVERAVDGACEDRPDAGAAAEPGPVGDGGASGIEGTVPVRTLGGGSVGSYEYVNLAIDAEGDAAVEAARAWLADHGYANAVDADALAPYLEAGLDLLVFELHADSDPGTVRPVALTYEGPRPVIPLRATAVAAREDLALQVWVVGPSHAVPDNVKSLVINDAMIDWLSARAYPAGTLPANGTGPFGGYVEPPANYVAVVRDAVAEAGGQGLVTELAAPASQLREALWSPLDEELFAGVVGGNYADGLEAIAAARAHYGSWDGFGEAVAGATTLPADVPIEALARDPERYRDVASVDTGKFLELLEERVVGPVAGTAALLRRGPYLTRLFGTVSPRRMTLDPAFGYNADLAQIGAARIARQRIECAPGLDLDDAPWRMELPQGGVVLGRGGDGWPLPAGSLPANLKVVMLSMHGAGTVLEDNREAIVRGLGELVGGGAADATAPQVPRHGLQIGGAQTLAVHREPATTRGRRISYGSCSVAAPGAQRGVGAGLALVVAAAGLVLRRRCRCAREAGGRR